MGETILLKLAILAGGGLFCFVLPVAIVVVMLLSRGRSGRDE